jgi:hypothetical protein
MYQEPVSPINSSSSSSLVLLFFFGGADEVVGCALVLLLLLELVFPLPLLLATDGGGALFGGTGLPSLLQTILFKSKNIFKVPRNF